MNRDLAKRLRPLNRALADVDLKMRREYSGGLPQLVFAKPTTPQPGGESDWSSCTGAAVSAGVAHLIGCVNDDQNPGESPEDMIKRGGDEAELASLIAQLRCWIGKKTGEVFQ